MGRIVAGERGPNMSEDALKLSPANHFRSDYLVQAAALLDPDLRPVAGMSLRGQQ